MKLLTRAQFNDGIFTRDNHKCSICEFTEDLAAHHIIDRKCFIDGGYYLDNGILLCEKCHVKAENGFYTCDQLREYAKITKIFLPKEFNPSLDYDKWGNIVKEKFIRYPRTPHIEGSGISRDDSKETIPWEELFQKHLVIEEKIDGGSSAISFDSNCNLLLQCRGHYLGGGKDWPEFDQFKVWANTWKDQLFDIITDRYIMYGEWMGSFHSVFYDMLPHFFMEFDIWDKKEKCFLSTLNRYCILQTSKLPIHSVRVIKQGVFNNKEDILSCIGKSAFVSERSVQVLEDLLRKNRIPEQDIKILLDLNREQLMEGLYIKWEEGGIVKGRYKFVRPEFVKAILDYGKHWLERKSIPNILAPDANMFKLKENDL